MKNIIYSIPDNYNKTNTIIFKPLEWYDRDEKLPDSDSDEPNLKKEINEQFYIYCFGRTEDKISVTLKITDYTPFFHILLPDNWIKKYNIFLIKELQKKIYYTHKNSIIEKLCKIVQKKPLDYFRGNNTCNFLRLTFKTKKAFYAYSKLLKDKIYLPFLHKKIKFDLYESVLEPKLKFFHLRNIKPCNWIECTKCDSNIYCSMDQLNYKVKWTNIKHIENNNTCDFLVMSYDIECTADDGVSFPEAKNKHDSIIQIGSTFHWHGVNEIPKIIYKHIITLKDCDKIDDTVVESYDTEQEVLIAWTKLIQRTNPDIHIGYNIFGFDYKYLYDRANMYYIVPEFSCLSKLIDFQCKLETKILCSSALGMNEMYIPKIPGVVLVDIYKVIMNWFKLSNYKLNSVSELYLNQKKNDVSPKEIFKLQKGNSKDRKIIAEYCIQDNILCNLLSEKLCIILNNIGMANICYIPLSYLYLRGQGIKTQSLIARECLKHNYLMKTLYIDDKLGETSYEGAIVLEPHKSELFLEPVNVLDFNSLYPAIMMGWNICISTFCKNKSFINLPDYNYENIKFTDTSNGEVTHCFAKNKNNERGILPLVVSTLIEERRRVKKLMKNESDPMKTKMFNSEQLALKISANSVYGGLGARTSQIYCREAAASITAMARHNLLFSKDYAEKHFNSRCVYGDSVCKNTLISLKINNKIIIQKINTIGTDWCKYLNNKEQINNFKKNVYCLTHMGWKPIQRIIRHKTKKKMYKIYTNKGIITVTEDHSLINDKLKIIKVLNIKKKDILLNYKFNLHKTIKFG